MSVNEIIYIYHLLFAFKKIMLFTFGKKTCM